MYELQPKKLNRIYTKHLLRQVLFSCLHGRNEIAWQTSIKGIMVEIGVDTTKPYQTFVTKTICMIRY